MDTMVYYAADTLVLAFFALATTAVLMVLIMLVKSFAKWVRCG